MTNHLNNKIILVVSQLILIFIVLYLGHMYGTRYGTAWGDEQLFVEIGETYSNINALKAPSFEGNGSQLSNKIYLYPPVYALTIGCWFKLVKPNLSNARLLSNIVGAISVSVFMLLVFSLFKNIIIAVVISVLLAINVQYAHLYNWARPDIMAIMFSFISLFCYVKEKESAGIITPIQLATSWGLATLGMLTHPVGGLIGFATIPLHLLLTAPKEFRKYSTWLIIIFIPLVGLTLWGIYICQDVKTFIFQFFEWQSQRKAARFPTVGSYVQLIWSTVLNNGVFGRGAWGWASSGFLFVVFIALFFDSKRHKAVLLILVLLVSNFAVSFGAEEAYPPLRMPGFFLSVGFLLWVMTGNKSIKEILTSRLVLLVSLIILVPAIYKSLNDVLSLNYEINKSERAISYEPSTLANRIIMAIPAGSSLGIRIFPACYDVLKASRHFSSIKPLAWARLKRDDLGKYVLSNEYLAITESFTESRNAGSLVNVTKGWGADEYFEIASKHYVLLSKVELPGGAVTAIYKKRG